MYSLVALGTCVLLWPQSLEHFSSCKTETLNPLNNNSPFPFPPDPRPWPFHFVSLNLTALCTSDKGSHTVFVLLCLTYFTEHGVTKFHPGCSTCRNFLPSGRIIVCHMDIPHFVYPFICGWTFGSFHLLAVVSNAALSLGVLTFSWTSLALWEMNCGAKVDVDYFSDTGFWEKAL